jgi:hypothetical protein
MKKLKKLLIVLIAIIAGTAGVYYVIAGTVSDSYDDDTKIAAVWRVSTSTSGEIKLASKECEVTEWFCSASTTCANYAGDGDYIIVAQSDAPTTKQWKTANTSCDRPECGADGPQNDDDLVNDNTVDFTDYPARDYCKSIGARLPTRDELSCMYMNRASFGNSFGASYYWSSTENSETSAWYRNFSTGSEDNDGKTSTNYVRCVRGW